MPALSYHVHAPSLEVVEIQLEVQVVPTGRECLELVWEAGAVAATEQQGVTNQTNMISLMCLYFADQALSSGLSRSVPSPRNPSPYSQGELGRLKYLLHMFFLPCPVSFSAGTKLCQG